MSVLIAFLIIPLTLTGIIHHFLIIRFNLMKILAIPVDADFTFSGKPLLGTSKTWRGLIVVPVVNGIITAVLTHFFPWPFPVHPLYLGLLIGSGYALAELPTSFIKRRLGIAPSHNAGGILGFILSVWDQTDSVIGALFAAHIVLPDITPSQSILLWITGTGIHLILDMILYARGYKEKIQKPHIITKILSRLQRQ